MTAIFERSFRVGHQVIKYEKEPFPKNVRMIFFFQISFLTIEMPY